MEKRTGSEGSPSEKRKSPDKNNRSAAEKSAASFAYKKKSYGEKAAAGKAKKPDKKTAAERSHAGKSAVKTSMAGKSTERKSTAPEKVQKTKSRCPWSGRCGGCTMIDVPYEDQIREKQKVVEELIGDFGPVEPFIKMKNPGRYRNKVTSICGIDSHKKPICGVFRERSHEIIPVKTCLIQDRRADAIVQSVFSLFPSFKMKVYDERTGYGMVKAIQVRCARATGQIMVTLVTSGPAFPSRKNFVDALLKLEPSITTIVQNINDRDTTMVLGTREKVLYGNGYIEDTLLGKTFRLSSRSFYQVNSIQTEKLYNIAIDMAGLSGKERVLDAYCGIGTIGICASDKAKEVIGVELNEDAAADAQENARLNHADNVTIYADDAGQFMTEMAQKKEPVDVLFMDPPRSGASFDFLQSALILAPKKIVYISCNPETLADNLSYLTDGGYVMKKAVPVDMFPYTESMETVCLLSKLSEAKNHISVKVDIDEIDVTAAESKATYEEVQEWVQEKYGFHVTHLNIAKTKRKCGIIERINYNLPKSENSKSPGTPKEKEDAIIDAFKHFQMI